MFFLPWNSSLLEGVSDVLLMHLLPTLTDQSKTIFYGWKYTEFNLFEYLVFLVYTKVLERLNWTL